MNSRAACLLCLASSISAFAAAAEPVVELPPMIVTESAGTVKWLYAQVGRDEYVSRCSRTATRTFIESRERQRQSLRALMPDDFLAPWPTITLPHDVSQKPRPDDVIAVDSRQRGTGARDRL